MNYKIIPENHLIDYGDVQFNEWYNDNFFVIKNTKTVCFNYKIDTSKIKNKPCLQISPIVGKIGALSS